MEIAADDNIIVAAHAADELEMEVGPLQQPDPVVNLKPAYMKRSVEEKCQSFELAYKSENRMKIYYKDQNIKLKVEIASLKAQLKSASNNENGNADKFARTWNDKFSKSDRVYSDFSCRHQYRKQKSLWRCAASTALRNRSKTTK